MSSKVQFVGVLAVCVIAFSLTGCRNRCQQPCGGVPYQQQPIPNFYGYNAQGYNPQAYTAQAYQAPGFAGTNAAGRSPVIPPPATGTLNIPSLARNNPFGINPNRGLINTQQPAPTAANRSARFNFQNGWQPVGGNSRTTNTPSNSGQTPGNTTLGSNSGSGNGSAAPSSARSVLVQDTQSRSNLGYGDSYVRSPNYSTTAVNETFDRTRLPATDASGVRAPSQYYARATGAQVAQIPGQGGVGVQQPNYYSGTFRAPNAIGFNVAPGVIQPGVNPAGVIASRGNVIVQDQSTATYDPYGNTRSADWRNRDAIGGTFQ
jgi:hypothetical protein